MRTSEISRWESLPSEINHYVFQQVGREDLRACVLVCKAWLPSAQTALYSKVSIEHIEQLEQFHQTIEHNPQMGMKVKSFDLGKIMKDNIDLKKRTALKKIIFNIMNSLIATRLPNLQVFRDCTAVSYVPIVDALIESRLKFLKRLESPFTSELNRNLLVYTTCALLIRDRLENLFLYGGYGRNLEQLYFNRLYSKLDQFSQIKEITIDKDTPEGIQLLDDVIDKCPSSLEKIWCNIHPCDPFMKPDDFETFVNKNISMYEISTLAPKSNVKVFISRLSRALDDKILMYIMRKFPQLEELTLEHFYNDTHIISANVFEQFLHYVSRLSEVDVYRLNVDQGSIIESYANFWDATTEKGWEHVKFRYSEYVSRDKISLGKDITTIDYAISENQETDWKHLRFIEENGVFLQKVEFSFQLLNYDEPDMYTLPDDLIRYIFGFCPYIQILRLEHCNLETMCLVERERLDELYLLYCYIFDDAMESISKVLYEVDHLWIMDTRMIVSESDYFDEDKEEIIWMPYTEINTITIGVYENHIRQVKLHCNQRYYYYALYHDITDAFPSTEEDFMNGDESDQIEICCKSRPIIKSELMKEEKKYRGF